MDLTMWTTILLGGVVAVELTRWYVNVSKRLEQSQMIVEFLTHLEQKSQNEMN